MGQIGKFYPEIQTFGGKSMCYSAFVLILVVTFLSSNASVYSADEKQEVKVVSQLAISEYEKVDASSAIEFLSTQDDPLFAIQGFRAAMRQAYWKKKDIEMSLTFGRGGFQYGVIMSQVLKRDDPEKAKKLRAEAKGFVYDIASFTWPGWDEKEIKLTDHMISEGLQSAKANLRLAIEMNKKPVAMSRAYWMLGAQELAHQKYEKSRISFLEAAKFAKLGKSPSEQYLCKAFECLAEYLSLDGDKVVLERLEVLLEQLRKQKDGEFYANQVDTARRVFLQK